MSINGGLLGIPNRAWQLTGVTITNITANGINYRVHTFTSGGTLVVVGPQGIYSLADIANMEIGVEFMILAGGGGGGGANNFQCAGGGGGGGGIKTGTIGLSIGSYTVVVGTGGAGATSGTTVNGSNGGDSSAFGITANGGGGGGGSSSGATGNAGSSGGNGGGGGNGAAGGTSTASTPAQGSSVAGQTGSSALGIGGMGASLGLTTYHPITGSGAGAFFPVGMASSISGTTTIYARGGYPNSADQTARANNTGDGGIGAAVTSGSGPGWAGGSGIVIITYRV
jgi:hypothetical protein